MEQSQSVITKRQTLRILQSCALMNDGFSNLELNKLGFYLGELDVSRDLINILQSVSKKLVNNKNGGGTFS